MNGKLFMINQALLSLLRPRIQFNQTFQIACPNYTKNYNGKTYQYDYLGLHRMKIDLIKRKYWCPKCRVSGSLDNLPIKLKS